MRLTTTFSMIRVALCSFVFLCAIEMAAWPIYPVVWYQDLQPHIAWWQFQIFALIGEFICYPAICFAQAVVPPIYKAGFTCFSVQSLGWIIYWSYTLVLMAMIFALTVFAERRLLYRHSREA
jgi:hypothetical protein